MAVVYRGRDTALDREVAVKLLHPHLAARAESRARFSREARAVARLRHPNIVEIYDYAGDAAVESYLVTEFVHGRTLRAFAEQELRGLPEVGALLSRALADALVHAHAAGVIHRDLKPENVLVLEAGGPRAVKLVDFGIARIVAADERMTLTGALVGSPNHMAPEIIEGREADARSDVFSLGTILYWLTTGKMPFAAANPTATLRRVIEGEREDPRQVSPLVSDPLAAVIDGALQVDPERRLPSAEALRGALDDALASSGLDDAPVELEAFLRDPGGYQAALRPRLVVAALGAGDLALGRGETARGMKLLDRVLALEPENSVVSQRLARIARRARWERRGRRSAAALTVLALMAAGAWGAQRGWQARRAEAPYELAPLPSHPSMRAGREDAPATATANSTSTSKSTPNRPSTAIPHASPTQGPGGLASSPSKGESRAEARRTVAVAPAIVQVRVRPYAQRALLDGVEVARGEQSVAFQLSPGVPHRIQIEHACCFPFVRDFAAGEPVTQPLELPVPLRPRPARLRVEGDPATRVFVDGRFLGTAGQSQRGALEIAVPPGGESPYEAAAELRLEADGRAPFRTSVRLRAGIDLTFAAGAAPPAPAASEPAPPVDPAAGAAAARPERLP